MKEIRKIKKFISLFLVTCMFGATLFGCGKSGEGTTSADSQNTEQSTTADTGEKTKIVYMQFSAGDDNIDTLEAMVSAFETENPDIDVEIQSLGYDDYFTALATKLTGDSGPDCFELNMENFLTYAVRDALEPLDSYVEDSGVDLSVMNENTLSAVTYNEAVYAIPQSFSTVVLFYNKDLFDKAGISYPTSDWTWEDEQKAAQAIRALGDDIWGTYQPVTYNELYKTVKANGGSLVNEGGTEFTLNTTQNSETLDMMLNRVRGENHVMPNTEDMAGRGDWDMFKSGNLGMIHTGIWAFNDFTENCNFGWDIVVEPGNTTKATHFFADVTAINPQSKNKEAAFKFMSYIATNADCVQKRLEAKWELPVVDDETIMSEYLKLGNPENRQAVLDSLAYAVAPPALEYYSEVSEIMNSYLEEATMNDTSATDVLQKIQDELNTRGLANK